MVRGLYTAWTGMANEQKRLDVISNNLANSATVGYKKEGVTSQSFDEQLTIKIKDRSEPITGDRIIGSMSLGVKIGEVYTDSENVTEKLIFDDNAYLKTDMRYFSKDMLIKKAFEQLKLSVRIQCVFFTKTIITSILVTIVNVFHIWIFFRYKCHRRIN